MTTTSVIASILLENWDRYESLFSFGVPERPINAILLDIQAKTGVIVNKLDIAFGLQELHASGAIDMKFLGTRYVCKLFIYVFQFKKYRFFRYLLPFTRVCLGCNVPLLLDDGAHRLFLSPENIIWGEGSPRPPQSLSFWKGFP